MLPSDTDESQTSLTGHAQWDNDLIERVQVHYANSSHPLLLSTLGSQLQSNGKWPREGDGRPLAQIIEALSDELVLVKNAITPTHIAVALVSNRNEIEMALAERQQVRIINNLPRALVIAFTLILDENQHIYFRCSSPFRYVIGEPANPDEFIPIESEYRRPGMEIYSSSFVGSADSADLITAIRAWASKHDFDLDQFKRIAQPNDLGDPASAERSNRTVSALERLMAAQSPGVASRITIPLDIAVHLSRRA